MQKYLIISFIAVLILFMIPSYTGHLHTSNNLWSTESGCDQIKYYSGAKENIPVEQLKETRYISDTGIMAYQFACEYDRYIDLSRRIISNVFSKCVTVDYGRFDANLYIVPDQDDGWELYIEPRIGDKFKMTFPKYCKIKKR